MWDVLKFLLGNKYDEAMKKSTKTSMTAENIHTQSDGSKVKRIYIQTTPAKKKGTMESKKSVKSPIQIRRSKQSLPQVDGELMFFVHNGPALRDLRELLQALSNMSDEQFFYHFSPERNDFALWVRHVFRDDVCARALERAKGRATVIRIIKSVLREYN